MSRKLLLHVCCAPCHVHVHELLKSEFAISAFFYNPNIAPRAEYEKRLNELKGHLETTGGDLITGEYDTRRWHRAIKPYRFLGERSKRCEECIRLRLEAAFRSARAGDFDIVATTLSISPHKDAAMINALGEELGRSFGVEFLNADFKKNDGYRESVRLSRIHGFYRQNYCGCIYSKLERDKNSLWSRKFSKKK